MNNSEKLHEFVDGSLDGMNEEQLFRELSESDDLRNELKQVLAIKTAVQKDLRAFVPPAESTLNLFAKLGFAAPALIIAPVPLGNAFSQFFAKYSQAIYSSLVTFILTAAGFLLFWNHDNSNVISTTATNSTQSVQQTPVPPTSGFRTESKNNIVEAAPKVITKYVYIEKSASALKNSDDNADLGPKSNISEQELPILASPIERENIKNQDLFRNAPFSTMNPSRNSFGSIEIPTLPLLGNFLGDEKGYLSIEMRGISAKSSVAPTVYDSRHPWFENIAVDVLYHFADNHALGLEFGQESYFQTFSFTDNNGKHFRYEQNPLLPWLGVAYRFSADAGKGFEPFAQVFGGSSQMGGILGRGMFGLRYSPEIRVEFLLGVEASNLWFQNQSSWYSSTKYGATYGVSVKF